VTARIPSCLLSHALHRAMAKSVAPHEPPGRALTAQKSVRVSTPKRPTPPRPHYLDWVLHHQIGNSLRSTEHNRIVGLTCTEVASALILGVLSLDTLSPPSRIYTRKFLNLSYPTETSGVYRQGPDDLYFVLAWVVNFTALRAISIEWVLQPLAESIRVVQKNRLRVAEQGWLVIYYGTFWGLGMVCCPACSLYE
jgi:acyl-CoA-dependent ceramide synthase